jgi:SHS2 domain-containing protein
MMETKNIGIIGHGDTMEASFATTAQILFSLITDVENIHPLQIITFEFEEENPETALRVFLTQLLAKSDELHIVFGDFRLIREGNIWKATVSGEPAREEIMQGIKVKSVSETLLSVKQINLVWEARCVLLVD